MENYLRIIVSDVYIHLEMVFIEMNLQEVYVVAFNKNIKIIIIRIIYSYYTNCIIKNISDNGNAYAGEAGSGITLYGTDNISKLCDICKIDKKIKIYAWILHK